MNAKSVVRMLIAAALLCAVLLFIVFPVSAGFTYTPVTAEIPVTLKNAGVSGEGNYYVIVEQETSDSPAPESDVITMAYGTRNINVVIDEPGTYSYKVYERTGNNSKIIYDKTKFTATLFVTSDDLGNLDYQVVLSNGGLLKPTEICFVNKAADSGSGSIVATGEDVRPMITLAVTAFAISGMITVIVLIRRKENTYE
ncbi:MAG: hypothetical protein IKE53_03730 [Clostridiales bacterium]|nr:hypothetical protein [Clostridiales bacterium]